MTSIHQISLFLENNPGRLARVARTLAEAKVNLVALSIAESTQFGIVRLIVDDWSLASEVLRKDGFAIRLTDVLAARVPDHPGGLADVLAILEKNGCNISYMYAFAFRRGAHAVLVLRFDNPQEAFLALSAGGVELVTEKDILG